MVILCHSVQDWPVRNFVGFFDGRMSGSSRAGIHLCWSPKLMLLIFGSVRHKVGVLRPVAASSGNWLDIQMPGTHPWPAHAQTRWGWACTGERVELWGCFSKPSGDRCACSSYEPLP